MAKLTDEMLTVLLEGEVNPTLIRFLQIRKNIAPHLETSKYPIRVDISWEYDPDSAGMPMDEVGRDMDALEGAVTKAMEKNKLALLTYKLTGEGIRLWVFYTRNLEAFGRTLNEATSELPLMPIKIYTEVDKEFVAYQEVVEMLPFAED